MTTRRTILYFSLALVTILCGLVLRLIHLGLPLFVVKYGGSVLWAIMVYLLLAALQPRRTPKSLALIATIVATVVELTRLYHPPALDAFRLTLAGALLLGRYFNPWHFLAYTAAIALAALADNAARRHKITT